MAQLLAKVTLHSFLKREWHEQVHKSLAQFYGMYIDPKVMIRLISRLPQGAHGLSSVPVAKPWLSPERTTSCLHLSLLASASQMQASSDRIAARSVCGKKLMVVYVSCSHNTVRVCAHVCVYIYIYQASRYK